MPSSNNPSYKRLDPDASDMVNQLINFKGTGNTVQEMSAPGAVVTKISVSSEQCAINGEPPRVHLGHL